MLLGVLLTAAYKFPQLFKAHLSVYRAISKYVTLKMTDVSSKHVW